jgi:hypothetical protein
MIGGGISLYPVTLSPLGGGATPPSDNVIPPKIVKPLDCIIIIIFLIIN